MKLRDLVAGIATVQPPADAGGIDIVSLSEDSRTVTPGCMFIPRPGEKANGRAFVAQAIANGAVAVLYDDADGAGDPCPPDSTVARVKLNPARPSKDSAASSADAASSAAAAASAPATTGSAATSCSAAPTALALAACRMAERLEGEPSEWLSVIGITGTNGKTTMSFLVQQFVRAGGSPCGVIGTVVVDDGVDVETAQLTTPGGIAGSAALGRMVRNGCTACAMEVSSHALAQGRTSAIRFRTAVFSNLTGDHLDYHKTMDEYAAAKAKLFAQLPADGTAVVNIDDPWHERMIACCRARILRCSVAAQPTGGGSITRYGYATRSPDLCTATIHESRLGWQDTTFEGPFGTVRVKLPLIGRHNVMNALQAAAAAHSVGVSDEAIATALAECKAPPGRLEPVTTPDSPFAVLVDYAHSDDALLNVLTALRPLVSKGGRLVVVFGCGGNRDVSKRPRMMKVACEHADHVVVTSDNPRHEKAEEIIDQVMAGRPDGFKSVQRQADRARAIELAVAGAKAGDIVLIAGKGHEDYQIIGDVKRPFDDRAVARISLGQDPCVAAGVPA